MEGRYKVITALQVEKNYPRFLAGVASLVWWLLHRDFPSDVKEFLTAALTLGAILTGFLATAKAILVTCSATSVLQQLRSSGYIKELYEYLRSGLYGSLVFSVYCLIGFFFSKNEQITLPEYYELIWIFLAMYALLTFVRLTNIMFKIIEKA